MTVRRYGWSRLDCCLLTSREQCLSREGANLMLNNSHRRHQNVVTSNQLLYANTPYNINKKAAWEGLWEESVLLYSSTATRRTRKCCWKSSKENQWDQTPLSWGHMRHAVIVGPLWSFSALSSRRSVHSNHETKTQLHQGDPHSILF